MLKSASRLFRRAVGKTLRATGLRRRPIAPALPEWLEALYPGLTEGQLRERLTEDAAADRAGRVLRLHYPPSYDLRPRWGGSRPTHQGLTELFARSDAAYDNFFRELAALLPWLEKIRRQFAADGTGEPGWNGGPINPIDTAALYTFVAKSRPKTYLEIGSGVTTLFAARAKRDHGLRTRIVSIDPNPRTEVDARCDEVLRAPLELCDLGVFDRLEPGDIVFMDGSHISLMNSDVTVFMLDVLPRLKPGVVVHFHDIHLPYDYPEMFVSWYWNEQYILASYLLGAGDRVRLLLPTRYAAERPAAAEILRPVIDAGLAERGGWLSGGSLWFTHVS
jgi:hypothetical protein